MEPLGSFGIFKKSSPPVPIMTQINPVQAPILFLEGIFLILSSNVRLCHPSGFFLSGFPSHEPRASTISFFLIWSCEYYLAISID